MVLELVAGLHSELAERLAQVIVDRARLRHVLSPTSCSGRPEVGVEAGPYGRSAGSSPFVGTTRTGTSQWWRT
jgi:hypothetical protein